VQARRRQYRHQPHADVALVGQASRRPARWRRRPATSFSLQAQQLADLTALVAANGRAQALPMPSAPRRRTGAEQRRRFLTPGSGYQPGNAQMFHGTTERGVMDGKPSRAIGVVFVAFAITATAIEMTGPPSGRTTVAQVRRHRAIRCARNSRGVAHGRSRRARSVLPARLGREPPPLPGPARAGRVPEPTAPAPSMPDQGGSR
jgi:hypothetical protein